ncbi:SMAD/FHA domain-containing protein [Wolfiporia cocos MD-104 SS10]|uniref:SMAD/FHA domain-containing protein n=1 Tax=Wolfiporia cocos (strain MD-104) TaxID=742152 RepID=A0A2H3JQS4_WOLCO|nr:SMAD/FHA domain-containing protein [Wolfiporia cocos MD-104 SS10]
MARDSTSPPRRHRYEDHHESSHGRRDDRYSWRKYEENDRRYEHEGRGGRSYSQRDGEGSDRKDRRRSERDEEDVNRRDRRRSERDEEDTRRYRDQERDRDRDQRAGPSRRSASPRRHRSRGRSRESSTKNEPQEPEDKAKPNFAASGLLAAATKTVKHTDGTKTVLKYHEPPEARKPVIGWRLYVFKGQEQVDLLHIHRQSAYLIGRDRTIADIAIDHPSCSKQHAVIQYRQMREKSEFGDIKNVIKPFIIDLESTNGTHVNDEAIPESRYYELKPGDVIKFGESQREYVLLHDEAA